MDLRRIAGRLSSIVIASALLLVTSSTGRAWPFRDRDRPSASGNSSYRDIAVTGLECPPQLPINNQARIVAFVDAIGFGGHVVKVQLEEEEEHGKD